jgi:outer membrane protein insertion porin family
VNGEGRSHAAVPASQPYTGSLRDLEASLEPPDKSSAETQGSRCAGREEVVSRRQWAGLSCTSVLGLLLPLAPLAAQEPGAGAPLVERVEVTGNQYLQRETILYYVSTKAGDAFDAGKLREDFRRLWDTGFLDDLQVEADDSARGKVVRFKVTERKRIQIVDYRGSKELTTSTIEDELKKKDAQIKIDTFYDAQKARKVEAIIKEMLNQKGRSFCTVKHEAKNIGGSGQQLSFVIDDGPKAKVHEIVFDGNSVFSDGKLRGRMKKIMQPGFLNLSWLGGKTTYTESKWLGGEEDPRGDRGRLEDFYLNHGYVTARIGQPRITYTDKPGASKKKPVKLMKLEIPVSEGEQYRMGELKFEGLTVLKEPFVRTYFKMKPGDVYNDARFKKAYEKLRDVYGSLGYFQWTGGTERKPDPEKKVVDITVKMEEDKQYFVGEIKFTGNDSTRDKVIRREIYMNEGEVFNTEALKMSIKRVNQLGYFKPMEGAPDIQPNEKADNKVDVTFKVEEQNRNQFTFGGGVSGYEGAFLNASFSTTNFLGAGETVTVAAQTGSRTKNYQLSISEPYFLDRPITAGLNVFLSRITYLSYGATVVGYGQQMQGIGVTTGIAVGRSSRVFANYSYQIIDIYDVNKETISRLASSPYASGSILPSLDPSYFGGTGRRRESSISPSFVRNTVDNPYLPRSGSRYTASFQYVGGFLGGTVNYIRPSLELVRYQPVGRRMALGVRGEIGYIHPFAETKVLPYYQRYFLGGETQIRGYNIRTVAPYDPVTKTSIGGNKMLLFNAEYYFDVFGPLRLLLFFDAGQAYTDRERFYWQTMSTSTGVEARFTMPVLNVPFRLIYAWNPNRDFYQPDHAFKFAVGTTF